MRFPTTSTVLPRLLGLLAATLIMLAVAAPTANAHPLGNFSINFSSSIRVEPTAVAVVVVMDAAEIPTARTFPQGVRTAEAEMTAYRTDRCAQVADAAELRLDDARQALTVAGSEISLPTGAAGLATTLLTCQLRTSAALEPAGATLAYRLAIEADRLGWREITAVGDGVVLTGSTVPTDSPSQTLTRYPEDLLASPLSVDEATMEVRSGSGQVSGQAAAPGAPADSLSRGVDQLTTAYTNLIASRDLTLAFGLLAVVLAIGLGAMHAFAPGHGKTLMAATLVGREGTLRQAVTIGLSVTVTHSVGVLLLGIALTFTSLAAPEQVYPWLGLVSGALLVAIGITLLRAAMNRPPVLAAAHAHAHHGHAQHGHGPGGAHDHSHGVEAVAHSHGFFSHTHQPAQLGTKSLLAVGFTGGLVPSPSALLVLLGGIALGRAWFGVVLVIAYGVGMATALVAVGLVLVRGRDWLEQHADRFAPRGRGTAAARFMRRWLPAATSSLVIMIGLGVAARAASSI